MECPIIFQKILKSIGVNDLSFPEVRLVARALFKKRKLSKSAVETELGINNQGQRHFILNFQLGKLCHILIKIDK